MADVATMKDVPRYSVCAEHHTTWPTICGCRVMRVMPVSHKCWRKGEGKGGQYVGCEGQC